MSKRERKVLRSFNLPRHPIKTALKLIIFDEENGKAVIFNVTIERFRITSNFIEIQTSVHEIGGKQFNRLLHSLPVGENASRGWIALAKVPSENEHDWSANWQVLEFTPQGQ